MKKSWLLVAIAIVVFGIPGVAFTCTSFIAGKNATADGSVLAVHNEDLRADTAQRVEVFQRKHFKKNEIEYLESGMPLPWVPMKYKVINFNSGYDVTDYNGDNPNYLNEFGVTCWDNAMTPRTELRAIEDAKAQLVDSKELKRYPLERARTAREAVQILGYLVDTYGFMQSGMAYGVADPNEGWIVEVTKGKHWIAQRVPDDMVVMRSNCYRVGVVNLADTANFLGSPDLIDFAVAQGWYNPASGPFNFAEAYGSPSSMAAASNTVREWFGLNFLKPSLSLQLGDPLPYVVTRGIVDGVVPDHLLTVQDAFDFLRSHYEGTEMDATEGYENGSPHWTSNRVICVTTTNSSSVVQLRNWMPADVGHVIWRADNQPCSSVYVPWYLGISTTPQVFRTGTSVYSADSAWWVYTLLAQLINPHYKVFIEKVRPVFEEMEMNLLAAQGDVEAKALALNPKQRAKYLTQYCGDTALDALAVTQEKVGELIKASAVTSWKNPVCVCP